MVRTAGLVLFLLGVLAGCGGESRAPDGGGEAALDAPALLATARELHAAGLHEQALLLCDDIQDGAAGSEEHRASRYLAAQAWMALKNREKAVEVYEDLTSRFPEEAPRAGLETARLYVDLWEWEKALLVLKELAGLERADDATREEAGALEERVRPMVTLQAVLHETFHTPSKRVAAHLGGAEVKPPGCLWFPEKPLNFSVDSKGMVVWVRKPETGVLHPLPWRGGSFRLSFEMNVISLEQETLQVNLTLGMMSFTLFDWATKASELQDALAVRVASHQIQSGVEKMRRLLFERFGQDGEGSHVRSHQAMADVSLDTWYRVVIAYSRELGQARALVYRRQARQEELVGRSVIVKARPFSGDLRYGFCLKSGQVGTADTMQVRLRNVQFETVPDEGARARWDAFGPGWRAKAALSVGLTGAALRLFEGIEPDPNPAYNRFYRRLALVRLGRLEKALVQDAWFRERKGRMPPHFIDHLRWWAAYEPQARQVLALVQGK